jgi:hypothetical protein
VTASHDPNTVELLSTRRQVEHLRDLQRLAEERSRDEVRISEQLTKGLREAETARDSAAQKVERRFTEERAKATAEFEHISDDARRLYEEARQAAQREYQGLRAGVESELTRTRDAAQAERETASFEALTLFDAVKGRPRERFLETARKLELSNQELAVLENDALEIMNMRRQGVNPSQRVEADSARAGPSPGLSLPNASAPVNGALNSAATPIERADQWTAAVRNATIELQRQKLPRLFGGVAPLGLFVLFWLFAAIISGSLLGWGSWHWVAASLVAAAVATVAILAWLWPVASRQSHRQFQNIQQLLGDARQALRSALEEARETSQREAQALVAERDRQISTVEKKVHAIVGERERWKESEIGRAGQDYPQRLAHLRSDLDGSLRAAKQKHVETLAQISDERDRGAAETRNEYARRCRELRAAHDRQWTAMADRWNTGLSDLHSIWDRTGRECARLFPDWNTTDYENWTKPAEPTPAIQFGNLSLDLANVNGGLSPDQRLRPAQTVHTLPALMTLDEHPVLLITAEDEGRVQAVEILQLAMLRMLTAMPPGKVRFTILDPVGLGENFASFMHLTDFDELLIASRIWTDSRQIEEQLTRLTAHMETVLQKYLRNEFATIHEYNAQAGEVAEPFQVLVVANFPTNFSESAARKLVSIATSGPRCGVYSLIMVDRKQKLPANFDLNDLTEGAVQLEWVPPSVAGETGSPPESYLLPGDEFDDPGSIGVAGATTSSSEGHFRWRLPAFENLPLTLDRSPSADRFNDVVRAAGRMAKLSMRVEVPFEQVAPPPSEYWTSDCSKELTVPVGRAGARRLQPVRLGKGTSQHLLVAGKTGSGKSTFLHALITNTALMYSPDEVEFYLIDFKKGVEFKTYATHHLPHARVIAIESEREFGLSVLERLDGELRRRGELFRAAGVQDLPDFRRARPNEPMPRVLLIVDEFQELFVEDDKLAQDAGLLLDRLVRQGRAFGIHVILGSQTLSGAYSLARSTMGQMAVRVALQCSEADAHLILSDERNEAARFLSRPGEAIYNDQNGLLAGNHPFQVVWLPESQRIDYLKQVRNKERASKIEDRDARPSSLTPRSLIVFEGDQPADPANNLQLRDTLQRASSPQPSASSLQRAWLGAAVAIKEPTAATFGRHAGSNLLVVGAWDESALGVLTNAVLALIAQNFGFRISDFGLKDANPQSAIRNPQFFILDGTRPEASEAGTWQRIAAAFPDQIEVAGPRDTARVINHLAGELARRESAADENAPPLYLVIFNGGRFRELRRGEDDFSFSMDRDKALSPDKQWAEILRSGPAWGIHTMLWCDSYNNVTRMLDRMALREFEMRVAFQMSAADSSSLLDNPAAAKLRQHRGLFASEDLGTLEKFRPYGIPTDEWLAEVRRAVHSAPDTQ